MKTGILAGAALLASSVSAYAVGLDRSGRPTGLIFEPGNVVEFSFGYTEPSIDGADATTSPTGNIGDDFLLWGAGIKYELNEKISFGLIVDEPYGADIFYGPTAPVLAGTSAVVDSSAVTAFGRYKFTENFSAHGGIVYQNLGGFVSLGGLAYAPAGLNGYNATFNNDDAFGYMVGVAYEIPEIALRVALTYHSEIDHDLTTSEAIGTTSIGPQSITEVTTPETIELAFQTGVAPGTLVFGSVRFSHYSVTAVRPVGLGGASLTDLENAWDAELGIGRRFNEKWSGSISIGWEQQGEDNMVSPLGSTNGATFLTVGAAYQVTDNVRVSGGVRFTQFGDAIPSVGGNPVGSFTDNSAISAGLRVQYTF